jgi:hypothetical protein
LTGEIGGSPDQPNHAAGLQGTEGAYRLQGTLSTPDLQVDAKSSKIEFQGESFGDLQLKGHLIGETVSYNVRAVFRRNLYHAIGTLTLGDHPVLESTLLLDGVKIRPFLRQFHFPFAQEIQGTVKGEVIVVYPFDQPEKLEVDARIQEFRPAVPPPAAPEHPDDLREGGRPAVVWTG